MSIKIETNEIENIFELVINKLKADKVEYIEVDEIMYWFINTDNWNVINENPENEVGSIKDDWDGLIKCKNKEEIISYTEFDRLASILRAISEKLAPIN